MSTQKRLYLLDAYALIFRGYFAFIKNPRINSKGMDTSAIMGFMNALMDVIKREKPDHLAVAFDNGGSDLRNEIFPEYKAHRDATPEAIKIAIPYIQKLLQAMHIPIIEVKGYEADDLIGTIAKQAEKQNYQVFMVTPDKDFAQLVSENIFSFSTILSGFSIFLLAAIAEELLFRGFMFQRLIKAFGEWPAQLVLAGLFLLTHINNPGMTGTVKILASINIFIASIMFGIAYIKTKSLAMPLGLHFMANYMQGTILGFGVSGSKDPSLFKPVFDNAPVWLSGGDFGMEASALGLCFVILITVLLYCWEPLKDKIITA